MAESNKEFLEQQRQALDRMREMKERSQIKSEPHTMPPVPSFVKLSGGQQQQIRQGESTPSATPKESENHSNNKTNRAYSRGDNRNSLLPNLKLPFGDNFKLDKDITLVLGLLLILANEKADRKLLLSLLYILM